MRFRNSIFVSALGAMAMAWLPAAVIAQQSTTGSAPQTGSQSTPQATQQSPPAQDLPDAPTANVPVAVAPNGPTIVMDTSMGRITCQVYQKQAPQAVANFVGLATGTKDWTDPNTKKVQHHKPLYDGTTFHRVIPEFMIQGGDPTGTGYGDPGYAFDDEIDPNLTFDRPGRLAMANSGPNTNGSQFFITEQGYETLNGHYTLFGQCDDASVAVVKAIARVPRDSNDKPQTPVELQKVTIVPEGQAVPPPPPGSAATAGDSATERPASARSAMASTPKRVAISAGVAQGMLLHKAPLAYPEEAKKAHISGTVVLQAVIGTDGRVTSLNVVSGPQALQQAALDSVKNWVYRPFLSNGDPVEVETTVNTFFMLTN